MGEQACRRGRHAKAAPRLGGANGSCLAVWANGGGVREGVARREGAAAARTPLPARPFLTALWRGPPCPPLRPPCRRHPRGCGARATVSAAAAGTGLRAAAVSSRQQTTTPPPPPSRGWRGSARRRRGGRGGGCGGQRGGERRRRPPPGGSGGLQGSGGGWETETDSLGAACGRVRHTHRPASRQLPGPEGGRPGGCGAGPAGLHRLKRDG